MFALLTLVLCTSPAELATGPEGRGGAGPNPEIYGPVLRSAPRFRFGVGTVGAFGVQNFDSYPEAAGGIGVSLEAGIVLGDILSILYRGELATSVGSLYGSNGLFCDVAIGEHLALGAGAAFTVWSQFVYIGATDYTLPFLGVTFPLRAHVMWGARKDESVARRAGWTISFHLAPGVSLIPNYRNQGFDASYGFALTGGVGIGYLWW